MLDETGLWRDVTELPSTVGETLDRRSGRSEVAAAGQGETAIRTPVPATADRRLAAFSTIPAAAALAGRLGLERGLDVDTPAWTEAYYRVARRAA